MRGREPGDIFEAARLVFVGSLDLHPITAFLVTKIVLMLLWLLCLLFWLVVVLQWFVLLGVVSIDLFATVVGDVRSP